MNEQSPQHPWYTWYKRSIAGQNPLLVAFIVWFAYETIPRIAVRHGLDRLSAELLGLCLAGGVAVTWLVLSFIPAKTPSIAQDPKLLQPWWKPLLIFVVISGIGIVLLAWLEEQFPGAAQQKNMIFWLQPEYVVWLLGGSLGWFGLLLLWKGWNVVRAAGAAGEMRKLSGPGVGLSVMAGGVAGYSLVVFLWPAARWGWPSLLAVAAGFLGLVLGLALDLVFEFGKWRLMRWLLACRLPHLREQLRSPNATERATAAGAIYRMGQHNADAVPDLLDALKDESADVRTQATLALWSSRANDPSLPETFRALLRDPEERVRIAAAGALVDLGAAKPAEVLPVLTEGLTHPDNQFANDIAAAKLFRLGPEAATAAPALRAAVFERQPPSTYALDALNSIGDAGIPILADALTHTDRLFRMCAANYLGRKGAAAALAVPALEAALADEDEAVRGAAARALKQIKG
jgi:hypothetical protein